MGALPTGTLTFLFTDIEGSTRLWDRQTEEMGSVLARHDEILRGCIDRHHGYVFTTAGDSFSAAFETAGDALTAAVEAQAVLRGEVWPEQVPVRVRMGLHTGVAEVRDDDYFGPDVIRAARIESSACGGQIVVSSATAQLVQDDRLRSLGRHELSGFDGNVELFQFGDDEFPALRTRTRRRDNLPAAGAPLLGRATIIDGLLALLEQHRLVTITGPGGIGKTSVAAGLGRSLAERSDAEVWWCDLVSVDADDVSAAVGRAIGLTSGEREPAVIAAVLSRRDETWLVVDNCEHVADAVASTVGALLAGSTVHVVATSRTPLAIRDEFVFSLPPLDPATSATDLFLREAGRVSAEAPQSLDRGIVGAICARLDGIPLAVELVAARTRALSLADIERRLADLLSTTGARRSGDVDRHATMATAIAWSVDLLDDELRPALGALAVFPGEFDLSAAEAILADETEADAVEAIETLVAQSLVEARRVEGGHVRYRVLEPIRQYSEHHLWRDPAATRHRHLEYFLDKLERAYDALGSTGCGPYLDVIHHDIADLAAVHDWALASGRIDDDLRLFGPFRVSWIHGCSEPSRWAEETADIEGIEQHDNWAAAWSAALSAKIGKVEPYVLSDFLDRHQFIARDDPSIDFADLALATTEGVFLQADWKDALTRFDRSVPEEISARWQWYFFGATTIAMAAEWTGNQPIDDAVDESIERFDQGLGWAVRIGARNFEAALLQGMASILTRNGRLEQGARTAREAELMSTALGMTTNANLSSYHQVNAALQGITIEGTPRTRLIQILASCVEQDPHAPTLAYTCQAAARVLAAAGDHHTAALCMLQPTVGFPDHLPRLAVDDIPEEVWTWAKSENSKLTLFDVGRRTLDALRTSTEGHEHT